MAFEHLNLDIRRSHSEGNGLWTGNELTEVAEDM